MSWGNSESRQNQIMISSSLLLLLRLIIGLPRLTQTYLGLFIVINEAGYQVANDEVEGHTSGVLCRAEYKSLQSVCRGCIESESQVTNYSTQSIKHINIYILRYTIIL